ncbi:metaxin-2-like [Saccoglossus kowalevskii]
MTTLVAQAVSSQMAGHERLPDTVSLFQPYEVKQILLPEAAKCLAVKTYLHMCDIKFHLELRTNAEQMSPSGGIPFVKVGPHIVAEFEPLLEFYALRGKSLSEDMVASQKAEMKAYMSLVINTLHMAECKTGIMESFIFLEVTE